MTGFRFFFLAVRLLLHPDVPFRTDWVPVVRQRCQHQVSPTASLSHPAAMSLCVCVCLCVCVRVCVCVYVYVLILYPPHARVHTHTCTHTHLRTHTHTHTHTQVMGCSTIRLQCTDRRSCSLSSRCGSSTSPSRRSPSNEPFPSYTCIERASPLVHVDRESGASPHCALIYVSWRL
jgi:hypothetical protein